MKTNPFVALVLTLLVSFFLGGFFAQAAGNPDMSLVASLTFFLLSFIPKKAPAGAMLMAINVGDIVTEFGNYYRAGSQSVKDLRIKLMQPSETETFFTTRTTKSTRIELGNASITRVLQSYQKAFTPTGDTTFKPQIIDLDHLKIDVTVSPYDVQETWLGYLAENNLKPEQAPLVKYWLEDLVIPKSKEDLELNEIFNGVKVAPTANTPGAAGSAMNGIKVKLQKPGIQQVILGAVPADPIEFVDFVETFFASIPELVRNACKRIGMNKTLELRYKQGKRAKYNMHYAQDTDLVKLVDFDAKVVGLASHVGSQVIWTTPEDNKILANKNPENETVFNLQVVDREVKGLTDFHKGVGFWTNDLVYRNDVNLAA